MDEVLFSSGDKTLDKSLLENIDGCGAAVTSGVETLKFSENTIGEEDSTDFLALTYLIHPPDGTTFIQPYQDDFWKCRWMRMEAEIRKMLRKSSRLASDVITLDSSSSSSEYDSSEYGDDDYEDSLASNSPIFLGEKRNSCAEKDTFDDIVLDENSSNAIVVGDEDDIEGDVDSDAVADDEVDEIVCSGETVEGDKDANSSIVVCDGENSTVGSNQPLSSTDALLAQPLDTDSANCGSSMPETDSDPSATLDVSVICAGSGKMANGSTDVPDPVDKTDKATAESEHMMDADVANGTCGMDEAN